MYSRVKKLKNGTRVNAECTEMIRSNRLSDTNRAMRLSPSRFRCSIIVVIFPFSPEAGRTFSAPSRPRSS
ncbi:MAG: hypothetical protein A4E42_01556 [Methanoregulaceae archaeon PtaU1.Bin222]|nr:MAG: hypothetical protein A4E42_01556 [Methanoregulaceae archaeon PtaU1.Bin222]